MPYRELSMLEVREVLRRYVGGAGLRAIARSPAPPTYRRNTSRTSIIDSSR